MDSTEETTANPQEEENEETQEETPEEFEDRGYDELESLCMRCGENGVTRMLMHKIPHFRELFLASFYCEHCGERNNEVTFGGEIQIHGTQIELLVTKPSDMDRQLVKSDSATIMLPDIEFEIPPLTQKGEISTIEGFLKTAANNLNLYQRERLLENPEVGLKVAEIIQTLTDYANGERLPFKICVDDPAGNSFIQNPYVPAVDPCMKQSYYYRTPQQDLSLGLQPEKGVYKDDKDSNFLGLVDKMTTQASAAVVEDSEGNVRLGRSEVIAIPSPCPNCNVMGESMTALTDIPHFKELIIMAFTCGTCGYRNSEVKGGGAVPEFGTEVKLMVTGPDDLKRDVLKSDSAMVMMPELELELAHGTLGGVFTTVEGLLTKIRTSLLENNPFAVGDSTTLHHSNQTEQADTKLRFKAFLDKLESYAKGEVFPFTLTLRDPLGNSFISAPLGSFLPPEMDKNIVLTDFERSFEDNEEFGLNDINTADYETGVDYDLHAKPDRLTHVTKKGPDHPTPFATAVPDATPGGVYFSNPTTTVKSQPEAPVMESTGGEGFWDLGSKLGWRAKRPGERDDDTEEVETAAVAEASIYTAEDLASLGKRVFNEFDKELKFDPREEFGGYREGYVFRLGALGMGYYEDRRNSILSMDK